MFGVPSRDEIAQRAHLGFLKREQLKLSDWCRAEEEVRARAGRSSPVARETILELAYKFWETRGGEIGSAESDWYRAEEEVRKQPVTKPPGRQEAEYAQRATFA